MQDRHSLEDKVTELPEDLINLPTNAEKNTVPVDVDELHETVKNKLYRYQNLKAIMESYKDVIVTIKGRMNVRKSLSDLNTYLDKVEDHQNDWLTEHYLSGTAMNSVEVIRDELVALIKAINDQGAAAAAATLFQQSSPLSQTSCQDLESSARENFP